MRKITKDAALAFHYYRRFKRSNTECKYGKMYLHGNLIAEHRVDGVYITDAGWPTATTKERLNGLYDVNIHQKNFIWYLNGEAWDGSWIKVK